MERPLLILTVEDLLLALILLVVAALGLTLRRRHRADHTDVDAAATMQPEEALSPAYDHLRALEGIEARTLAAIAAHRNRIAAMRQQLMHGTPEERELLDELQRLTFAAIAEQHDRALKDALSTRGEDG